MWKTNLIIYSSHFLSCWGNRMWQFGMSMFLVRIADDSIQLSATYGLATGLAVFVLGALVGDWVDNTPRLKAAQLSLVLQDALMLCCAVTVTLYLWYKDPILAFGGWLPTALKAVVVFFGVLSNLASQARIIAVERDWIVEICEKNTDHLASMTAMLRRIDQISMILAPMATGQVMTFIGLIYGAIFIGSWNIISVFVEFFLMWRVYNTVPALMSKKNTKRKDDTNVEEEITYSAPPQQRLSINGDADSGKAGDVKANGESETPACESGHCCLHHNGAGDAAKAVVLVKQPKADSPASPGGARAERHAVGKDGSATCLARAGRSRLLYQFVTLYRGCKIYFTYRVALPGVALAFLYLTVLGFDNITIAYSLTQGLSESVLGILMGSSAVFGIFGTFGYTIIRRYTGLVRTGFIALSCQVSCLTLCVVSIWMPGSPFDPFYTKAAVATTACNTTSATPLLTAVVDQNQSYPDVTTMSSDMGNATLLMDDCDISSDGTPDSYMSVIFLMTGIFLGRFGVWIADLTITQLFLEKVIPTQRGIVNGVQSSINQLMDLLKFSLVVLLPDMETFGFLIIISFCAIATAWLLYAVFVKREGVALCSCGRQLESSTREARNGGRSSNSDIADKDTLTKDELARLA